MSNPTPGIELVKETAAPAAVANREGWIENWGKIG